MSPAAQAPGSRTVQQIVMLSSLDDALNSFAAEDSRVPTAGRTAGMLQGDALSLFNVEAEPSVVAVRAVGSAGSIDPSRSRGLRRCASLVAAGGACLAITVAAVPVVSRLTGSHRAAPPAQSQIVSRLADPFDASVQWDRPAHVTPTPFAESAATTAGKRADAMPPLSSRPVRPPTAAVADDADADTVEPEARALSLSIGAATTVTPNAPVAADIPAATLPALPATSALRVVTASPVDAVVASPVVVREEAAVMAILNQYRAAYNDLDARAARAVWPSVDGQALGRAFDRLQSQELTFARCDIAIDGDMATARCGGQAQFVPKIGSRSLRVQPRQWSFDLWKAGQVWTIKRADVR